VTEWVSVLWAGSWVEAEIARGRLEAEGIDVEIRGEGADAPYPVGPVELLVPPGSAAEARRVLSLDPIPDEGVGDDNHPNAPRQG
jgi:hypothetical protein